MIYLDNAATSYPKAPLVGEAIADFILNHSGNSGRSSHKLSRFSDQILFTLREQLSEVLNTEDSENICFTQNATEALNTIILGYVKPGFKVLTSSVEHNSVMRPLRYLEKAKGIELITFKCDQFGYPDLDDYKQKLQLNPDFIVTTGCSNVTGTIFPFYEMSKLASNKNIFFCLDASQLIGCLPFDLAKGTFDAVCFPGHKSLLGPMGTGAFYVKDPERITPLKFGGTGSKSDLEVQPDFMPDKFESGTMNLTGLVGLSKALEFILNKGITNIREHKLDMISHFYNSLKTIDNINLFSIEDMNKQIGVFSFTSNIKSISDLTFELDNHDIASRMGLHCSPTTHKTIGTYDSGGTIRLSLGYFNTKEDIDITVNLLKNLMKG